MMVNSSEDPHCTFDPDEDKIKEECGVFGIFGIDNAASMTALGLHALQHRGQEACGIATSDGDTFHTERHFGLVGDNFQAMTLQVVYLGLYLLVIIVTLQPVVNGR